MQDTLEIPVTYKHEKLTFKAHVNSYAYNINIIVDLNGTEIAIERDEEGNFRVLGDAEKMNDSKIDMGLIEAIINVLQSF